jgi:hypothetical protein
VAVGGTGARPTKAVLDELIRFVAQGGVMHNDDTRMRVLKLVRVDDGRTGVFTSGIASCRAAGRSRCTLPDGSTRPEISPVS